MVDQGPPVAPPGLRCGGRFLALPGKPEAVVCFSDLVALGLMYGLSRAGVRPGIDIAVCGYDDIDEAAIAMPPLTTVSNGQAEVGHRAAGACSPV